MSDKMDKNDKEINDKIDKLSDKKSFIDYVKQVGGYLLSTLSALMKFVGTIVKYIGKAALGLGWILYVVMAAILSFVYMEVSKRRDKKDD